MNAELKKRIFTSLFLLIGMSLMFFYPYVLVGLLILLGVICWIEFYSLICKILDARHKGRDIYPPVEINILIFSFLKYKIDFII